MPPPPPPPPSTQHQQQQPASAFLSTVLNPHTTAAHTTPPPRQRPFGGGAAAAAAAAAPPPFSATQRSLQARGKEYNVLGRKEEGYEARQRREEASRILESVEMLIWWSAARNESLPQTRHHFTNIVLGIEDGDEDVEWKEEWEVAEERSVGSPRSAKGKERERGKRRVSSGVHA